MSSHSSANRDHSRGRRPSPVPVPPSNFNSDDSKEGSAARATNAGPYFTVKGATPESGRSSNSSVQSRERRSPVPPENDERIWSENGTRMDPGLQPRRSTSQRGSSQRRPDDDHRRSKSRDSRLNVPASEDYDSDSGVKYKNGRKGGRSRRTSQSTSHLPVQPRDPSRENRNRSSNSHDDQGGSVEQLFGAVVKKVKDNKGLIGAVAVGFGTLAVKEWRDSSKRDAQRQRSRSRNHSQHRRGEDY